MKVFAFLYSLRTSPLPSLSTYRFSRVIRKYSQTNRPIKLPHRQIIEVKGPDGCGFLQGLVTADVVSPTRVVQYGMFLNTQGRALYDVLFYHMGNERVWLECSTDSVNEVLKHLKKYVLRSKVTMCHVTDIDVYALLPNERDSKHDGELIRVPDPRNSLLGERLLISSTSSVGNEVGGADEYHRHRISYGIPEGSREIPPAQCLPFEVNIDLMKGVSFTKGCYIGQELTSRTHHTGVIRKRTLPLTLDDIPPGAIPWGTKIQTVTGKNTGKVISHHGNQLLGILRLPDLRSDEPLNLLLEEDNASPVIVTCQWHKPDWWAADN